MTAEQTEPGAWNDTTTVGEANQTETPELQSIITRVLEQYDGLCMDEPEEREQLAAALAAVLRTVQYNKPEDGDPKAKAAT